ncbi:MAG: peptidylprolyl isomerase [Shewanella algae]
MITLHTNHGDIKLALDSEKAPLTAANFIKYAQEGFYDGTIFHRVIDGFMVQGGGFTEQMSQKPTNAPVRNEANNGLSNKTGTIAMARTSDPHSATAQFFINVNDNTFLDFKNESIQGWGYCVFGEVVEGMDVVNAIKGVSTGNHGMHQDVPLEAVIIEKVTIAG